MSRLTEPQRRLLDELVDTKRGVLYIRRWGPFDRTTQALVRKGYIEVVEPDHSAMGQPGYGIVKCTGMAATYCSICGDCTCDRDRHTGEPIFASGEGSCPLHRLDARHGTIARWPESRAFAGPEMRP